MPPGQGAKVALHMQASPDSASSHQSSAAQSCGSEEKHSLTSSPGACRHGVVHTALGYEHDMFQQQPNDVVNGLGLCKRRGKPLSAPPMASIDSRVCVTPSEQQRAGPHRAASKPSKQGFEFSHHSADIDLRRPLSAVLPSKHPSLQGPVEVKPTPAFEPGKIESWRNEEHSANSDCAITEWLECDDKGNECTSADELEESGASGTEWDTMEMQSDLLAE